MSKNCAKKQKKNKNVRGKLIVLEGVIAAGKSTLATALEAYLTKTGFPVKVLVEPLDLAFLALYQSNIERYAFPFQCVMARERMQVYLGALRAIEDGWYIVMDRSLVGDVAFAVMQKEQNFFTDAEWRVYNSLVGLTDTNGQCKSIDAHFMPEATIIYLEVTPEEAFRRMLIRGNENEKKAYTQAYFQNLHRAYESAVARCADCTRIDWNVDRKIDDAVCVEVLERVPQLRSLLSDKGRNVELNK